MAIAPELVVLDSRRANRQRRASSAATTSRRARASPRATGAGTLRFKCPGCYAPLPGRPRSATSRDEPAGVLRWRRTTTHPRASGGATDRGLRRGNCYSGVGSRSRVGVLRTMLRRLRRALPSNRLKPTTTEENHELRHLALAPALILIVAACSGAGSTASPSMLPHHRRQPRPSAAAQRIEVKLTDTLKMEPADDDREGRPARHLRGDEHGRHPTTSSTSATRRRRTRTRWR